MDELESQRIDKWLWAARFFKTRRLAADAVSGGKVHVDGIRIKPSKLIRLGVNLEIVRKEFTCDVIVQALNNSRRPAKEAVLLYDETQESIDLRAKIAAEQKDIRISQLGISQAGRPNKKQRRSIIKFRQGG